MEGLSNCSKLSAWRASYNPRTNHEISKLIVFSEDGLRAEHGNMRGICQFAPIYMAFVTPTQ